MGDKAVTFVGGKLKQAGDTGTTDFDGNVNLGNADTDDIVFVGEVKSDIVPDDHDSYDLGSNAQSWQHLYLSGTANLNALKLNKQPTGSGSHWTYTVSSTDCIVMCAGDGGRTVNLPNAFGEGGRILMIKDVVGNAGSNSITVNAYSGNLIEGNSSHTLSTSRACIIIMCDGQSWHIVASV